ncbi:biotin--[acetyl-CoA-carboxylase] ligase [Brumimicrobium salinarum]|uniref:Biotin--[acetyl-CoA-carboxylase] ligase n=1 Tax=Brumimicrobium salinarum TaxID=2058658 RepID=A0A2I0R1Y7_9FLAO|nr:biotin--[acetyl-CoA-carboxylase] ligase [Brumimicrobium salinarum]PKR80594.1 biotin--[acetyl-CoA-carboxylase] ligase [Brumimicrobium salinarum]
MKNTFVGTNIIFLECVDSTNNYTANLFKSGAIDSGTVIMTDKQTSGRGQRQNEWHSDAFSNLLFSVAADLKLWKIKNIISLNHIVALSIHDFLSAHTENVKIKWPNDVMIEDEKSAGILIENQYSSQQVKSIIGIGININQQEFDLPRATSLKIATGQSYSPRNMIYSLVDILDGYVALYQHKGSEYLHSLYNEHLWKRNVNHVFQFDNQMKKGKIVTSTIEGELLVDINGHHHLFKNGEVKY